MYSWVLDSPPCWCPRRAIHQDIYTCVSPRAQPFDSFLTSRTVIVNRWFPAHFVIQLFLSGPVIFAGWYYGHQATKTFGTPNFSDPHEKMGLALLILYVIQLSLGLFTHYVKLRSPFGAGTRPPQNYFHVLLGLAILGLAAEQVRYSTWIRVLHSHGLDSVI